MREQVIEETLENKRIVLDGFSWKYCKFQNCDIIVSTGDFDLIGCTLNDCRLHLEGNAAAIVSIIELFFPGCLPFTGDRPKPSK